MIQIPKFQQVPMVPQPQFGQMPYFYQGMPMLQAPQQMPGFMISPSNMVNGNFGKNNSQMAFQNDYSMINDVDKKRPQSQNGQDFEDILDREKFKFDSSKNYKKGEVFQNQEPQQQIEPQFNGFKAGNHNNHFNPKNLRDLMLDKQKKSQYADQLNQQLKIKKDLEQEKKILETKQNIHLFLDRQKSNLMGYNMPNRDQFGNILQSRGQPGNRNYQMQDWFTHVPNINQKYVQEDDVQLMEQNKQGLFQNISNPNMRNLNDFQNQQQNLLNFENKFKKQQFNYNQSNGRESQVLNEQSQNFNRQNNQYFENQRNKGVQDNGSFAMNFDNYQEEEDDDNRPVRILTPTKFRTKAKGTQTPHTLDEMNDLQNQQISDLYPELLGKVQNEQFKTPPQSINQSRNQTSVTKMPSDLSHYQASSVRFTSYLKGDYKYANDSEKMRKREQHIQLQNDQLQQMEEKQRQKDFQKLQEKREKDLDDLRITREVYDINQRYMKESQYNSVDKTKLKESNLYENPSLRFGYSSPKNDAFSNFEVKHVTSTSRKKGQRPRTPIEDANNPFEKSQKYVESNQIVVQEIPIKVKEQVGQMVNEELVILRSELRASQGFVKNELQNLKSKITDMNQQKAEQEQNQNILATDINKTRLVDEIRRRELDQKIKDREKRDLQEAEDEQAKSILQNPGFARYDLENKKKIFFEYDDQYDYNLDRVNEDLGTIIKDGKLPSQKAIVNYNYGGINNNVKYLTYDEVFNKSSSDYLNRQQKIEDKLNKMGIKNIDLPKSPNNTFQQQNSSPQHSPVHTLSDQIKSFKNTSLTEINRPSAANSDIDDIYADLIKGNQEKSKIFKYKRDNDKIDIEDFVLWNSKAARYR